MKNHLLLLSSILIFFSACIGDDIINDRVPERLRISNPIDSIQIDTSFQFQATFFNNIGQLTSTQIDWSSSDESILSINNNGLATSIAPGEITVIASVLLEDNSRVEDQFDLVVSETPVVIIDEPEPEDLERTGTIVTTSSYVMTGDFILKKDGDNLLLEIAGNYQASSLLPGLYVYLTNNPNTINGALEIEKVTTFNGAHSYTIPNAELETYNYVLYFCKPFNVKVGDGEIN